MNGISNIHECCEIKMDENCMIQENKESRAKYFPNGTRKIPVWGWCVASLESEVSF